MPAENGHRQADPTGSGRVVLKDVSDWDTAPSYSWGRSQVGFGKYLVKYPEDRKKIFLVTKSGAWIFPWQSATAPRDCRLQS